MLLSSLNSLLPSKCSTYPDPNVLGLLHRNPSNLRQVSSLRSLDHFRHLEKHPRGLYKEAQPSLDRLKIETNPFSHKKIHKISQLTYVWYRVDHTAAVAWQPK